MSDTKFQASKPSGSEEEDFKYILNIGIGVFDAKCVDPVRLLLSKDILYAYFPRSSFD